jgi:hypothetical protein
MISGDNDAGPTVAMTFVRRINVHSRRWMTRFA